MGLRGSGFSKHDPPKRDAPWTLPDLMPVAQVTGVKIRNRFNNGYNAEALRTMKHATAALVSTQPQPTVKSQVRPPKPKLVTKEPRHHTLIEPPEAPARSLYCGKNVFQNTFYNQN